MNIIFQLMKTIGKSTRAPELTANPGSSPSEPFWAPCPSTSTFRVELRKLSKSTGEAHFCAPAFSYVLRSKKGPLLCYIVLLQFHSLEALKATCPDVFYSNHVLRHWSSTLALRPASNFVSSHNFLVCCNFHNLETLRLALRPSLCASCGLQF